MSAAEMLRISAGVAAGEAAGPSPRGRLGVATSRPSARGLRPSAPGRYAPEEKERLVTDEMRGFAESISSVRAGRGRNGIGRVV